MKIDSISVRFEADEHDWLQIRSREEHKMSKDAASQVSRDRVAAMAAFEDEVGLTDQDLQIAAAVGVTREELIEQKALDLLDDKEIRMMRGGLSAVEVLARRRTSR